MNDLREETGTATRWRRISPRSSTVL